ncbi:MAG: sugar O-acetyltransferase [Colwellia sp.]
MKTPFDSLTSILIGQRKSVHEVCRQFARSPSKGNLKRLKLLFHTCGEDVFIESGFHMDYGDNISLGNRVYININCTLLEGKNSNNGNIDTKKSTDDELSSGKIVIGDDAFIGPNVQLLAVSHAIDPIQRLSKKNYADDIVIGKNVWLGGGVIVLSGVHIGDNSVIGAGSVVSKNVEAMSFYAGNPAKKIRVL